MQSHCQVACLQWLLFLFCFIFINNARLYCQCSMLVMYIYIYNNCFGEGEKCPRGTKVRSRLRCARGEACNDTLVWPSPEWRHSARRQNARFSRSFAIWRRDLLRCVLAASRCVALRSVACARADWCMSAHPITRHFRYRNYRSTEINHRQQLQKVG